MEKFSYTLRYMVPKTCLTAPFLLFTLSFEWPTPDPNQMGDVMAYFWRKNLTKHLLERYLSKNAYYKMNVIDKTIDNPYVNILPSAWRYGGREDRMEGRERKEGRDAADDLIFFQVINV
jgi:hypothetical protein